MFLSIPLNPLRVLPDVRDVIVFHLVPNTSRNFENDLIQHRRTQYIDVVARVCTPTGNRRNRLMRKLVHDTRSHHGTSITKTVPYLNCCNPDASRIPPGTFPALGTHHAQAQQAYCPISFSYLDAITNLESRFST